MSEQYSDMDAAVTGQPADGGAPDDAGRQLAERTEDLQRVTAEYANYRRRVERDRVLVVDQAAERFAGQLFPIVDDIERARDHGDLTGAFKVVADRVLGLLDGLGVTAFGKAGDPFDPALHEAVLHDTSSEVSVPTATTVLRPGFRRGDRVLRTAMVGVTDPETLAAAQPGAAQQAPAAAQPTGDDGQVVDGQVVDGEVVDGGVIDGEVVDGEIVDAPADVPAGEPAASRQAGPGPAPGTAG